MDMKQLRAIVVLSEELNFVRAAARLGISQPGLSQQIQRAETELGALLFARSGRRVTPTEAGRLFARDSAHLVQNYDGAVASARRAAKGQVGRLRLGFVEAASVNVLPAIVSEYRRHAPEVQLELVEMISAELADGLQRRSIDVALTRPINLDDPIKSRVILREPYVVALAADHPLAGEASVSLSQVIDEGLILAPGPKAQYIRTVFRPLFERLGREPSVTQEVHQRYVVTGLVQLGLGYSLLPRSAAMLHREGIVYLPLSDADAPMAEMMVAWIQWEDAPPLVDFLSMVRRIFGT